MASAGLLWLPFAAEDDERFKVSSGVLREDGSDGDDLHLSKVAFDASAVFSFKSEATCTSNNDSKFRYVLFTLVDGRKDCVCTHLGH